MGPDCRLLIGLGNPGPEYEGTRHNLGFAVLDRLARELAVPFLRRGRVQVARGERGGAAFVLAKPITYMNRSGRAARDLLIDLGANVPLVVVCDDFNLPLGKLRFRIKGSAGGQKGLLSILEQCPERDVPRLRLGIGEPGKVAAEEYVLRPFRRGEEEEAARLVDGAAALLLRWLEDGDFDRLGSAANA